MTSTNPDPRIGEYCQEVEHQKFGPALLIVSSLASRAGLLNSLWSTFECQMGKEIEHSVHPCSLTQECNSNCDNLHPCE